MFDKNVKCDKMILVKYMSSRMDKYEKNAEVKETSTSRTARNKSIYGKVSDEEIDSLNLANNISVIETNAEDLDIDTIKDILSQQYESKKRHPSREANFDSAMESFDENPTEEKEITKEYDLKKVLETAHKNKTTDYNRERFLKLRETQFDILNSLNIDRTEEPEPEETLSEEEANLMNLIKTVNFNAEQSKALKKGQQKEEDDLLSDLLGDENTEVLAPVDIDMSVEPDKKPSLVEELEKTKQLSKKELGKEIDKYNELLESEDSIDHADETSETGTVDLTRTEQMANSFYTGKFQINDKDMDDFSDLEKEMSGGVVVKILIVILVLITLVVAVFLLNKYLNLGLF